MLFVPCLIYKAQLYSLSNSLLNEASIRWKESEQLQIKYFQTRQWHLFLPFVSQVWTGLRFLEGKWWWADGQVLDHGGMLPDCTSQWKNCGTLSKHDTNNWLPKDCSERRNFVCYRHKKNAKSVEWNQLDRICARFTLRLEVGIIRISEKIRLDTQKFTFLGWFYQNMRKNIITQREWGCH